MTKKRFIKLSTAIWHKWIKVSRGEFKEDIPLKLFLERRLRRGKKKGYEAEYNAVKKTFLPFEK